MPIAIKYNGPKPYTDHLYGSKLHWEIGDTRDDVPEHIAVKLLRHPEFEDARKYKSKIKVEEQPREEVEDLPPLQIDGQDFYHRCDMVLIHWRRGWSLILPQESRCPNLEDSGRCLVYPDRPDVCRRPQIFPYVLEPVEHRGQPAFRLRQSLLGVIDCPYVQQLQDEIAAFAAACELEMVFRHNKG